MKIPVKLIRVPAQEKSQETIKKLNDKYFKHEAGKKKRKVLKLKYTKKKISNWRRRNKNK